MESQPIVIVLLFVLSSTFINCYPSIIAEKVLDKTVIQRYLKGNTLNTTRLGLKYFGTLEKSNENFGMVKKWDASQNDYNHIDAVFMLQHFPHLREINFSFNKFESLEAKYLKGSIELTTISFSHNHISDIDGQAFKPLQDLTSLDLSNNKITTLNDTLFVYNSKLIYLNLKYNRINKFAYSIFSMCVERPIDVRLPTNSIEYLDVSCRGGNVCPFKGFQHGEVFEKIKSFNASGNHLQIDPLLNFKMSGTNLKQLDLSGNYITTLTKNILSGFENIKYVHLNRVGLKSIEKCAFCDNIYLQTLDLISNNLSTNELISALGPQNSYLDHLNLCGNQIDKKAVDEMVNKYEFKQLESNKDNLKMDANKNC